MHAARLLLIVGLLAALAGDAPVARRAAPTQASDRAEDSVAQPVPWLGHLRTWLAAVVEHQPGKLDEPTRTIGAWSQADLQEVLKAIVALREMLAREHERLARSRENSSTTTSTPRKVTYNKTDVPLTTLQEVFGLAGDEARRGEVSPLLRRGALLHAEIAMLSQSALIDWPTATSRAPVMWAIDGRTIGYAGSPFHWEFGRDLLDALTPDPAQDETARLWYHATSAYLLSTGDLASVERHLDHAQRLFPTDADILFECGYLREVFASPLVQSVVQSMAALNPRFMSAFALRSARTHLRDAEDLFRKAVSANPGLIEGRVRFAHVLSVRGRYAEAAGELRRAVDASPEPQLRYYAELLLGDAEQALGRRGAARQCYERAAALYPLAQSPYLALSQLARRGGDRAGAFRLIQSVLGLPPANLLRSDPWWTYSVWQSRNADDLLLALRQRVLSEEWR